MAQAMGMQYQDRDDALKNPLMGCYGIGCGPPANAAASVRELLARIREVPND